MKEKPVATLIGIFLFACAVVTVWQWLIFFIVFGGMIWVLARASMWRLNKILKTPRKGEIPPWQTTAMILSASRKQKH